MKIKEEIALPTKHQGQACGSSGLVAALYILTHIFRIYSAMGDIVFMTVVGQNVFSQSWNQTDDMFEEPTPGLLSTEFGLNKTGIFVYNRCGSLEGELQLFPVVPLNPSDIRLEW